MKMPHHEKQLEDLYKDVREIKHMNLKFMSMGKGLIIAFVVMTTVDIGLGDLIMKLLWLHFSQT